MKEIKKSHPEDVEDALEEAGGVAPALGGAEGGERGMQPRGRHRSSLSPLKARLSLSSLKSAAAAA